MRDLAGETVLLTAGPTREAIDPVRYITNRSSGKMGYAIATAAAARGAEVVLISGPVTLAPPLGVRLIMVETAAQMYNAVFAELPRATIVIKAAAVADYRPAVVASQKIKKQADDVVLHLEKTPDILAAVGRVKGSRFLVGFAAETNDVLQYGQRKLVEKNCDLLVANCVGRSGSGFESDHNEVALLARCGSIVHCESAPKTVIAERILDEIVRVRLRSRHPESSAEVLPEATVPEMS